MVLLFVEIKNSTLKYRTCSLGEPVEIHFDWIEILTLHTVYLLQYATHTGAKDFIDFQECLFLVTVLKS